MTDLPANIEDGDLPPTPENKENVWSKAKRVGAGLYSFLKPVALFIWKWKKVSGPILVGLLIWKLLGDFNLFSGWKSLLTKPETPVETKADEVKWTDPAGKKHSTYKNPSAGVKTVPVLDKETGKPAIVPKIQVWGLTLVPQVNLYWDFKEGRSGWLVGPQLAFYDAFGLGLGFNETMLAVVLDRRFKISAAGNLAVGVGAGNSYQETLAGQVALHPLVNATFKIGF